MAGAGGADDTLDIKLGEGQRLHAGGRAQPSHQQIDATGPQRLTLIALPGHPPLATLEQLGVARVSFGPISQNVALTALQELVEEVHRGGTAPATTRRLN